MSHLCRGCRAGVLAAGLGLWLAGAACLPGAATADGSDVAPPPVSSADRAAIRQKLAQGAMSRFAFAADPAPRLEATLSARGGGSIALSSLHGRIVLVNVWASWCAPCREEMTSLVRLTRRLGGPDLAILALGIDRRASEADRFLDTIGRHALAVYVDPETRAAKALGVRGVPASILVDREGREIGRIEGAVDWTSDEAILLLQSAITGRIGSPPGAAGR